MEFCCRYTLVIFCLVKGLTKNCIQTSHWRVPLLMNSPWQDISMIIKQCDGPVIVIIFFCKQQHTRSICTTVNCYKKKWCTSKKIGEQRWTAYRVVDRNVLLDSTHDRRVQIGSVTVTVLSKDLNGALIKVLDEVFTNYIKYFIGPSEKEENGYSEFGVFVNCPQGLSYGTFLWKSEKKKKCFRGNNACVPTIYKRLYVKL
jgi:hypothetical protein